MVEVSLEASQAWGPDTSVQSSFPTFSPSSTIDPLLLRDSAPSPSTPLSDPLEQSAEDEVKKLSDSTDNPLGEFVVVDSPTSSRKVLPCLRLFCSCHVLTVSLLEQSSSFFLCAFFSWSICKTASSAVGSGSELHPSRYAGELRGARCERCLRSVLSLQLHNDNSIQN